jgi:hypothetical protein
MIKFKSDSFLNEDELFKNILKVENNIVMCKNLDYHINDDNYGFCTLFDDTVSCNKKNIDDPCFINCNKCFLKDAVGIKQIKSMLQEYNPKFYKNEEKLSNFAIITAYFNPQKSKNRYNNFIKFRDHIINEQKIDLYVIEGYYYKDKPQLTKKDCPNLLTLEYYDILWQKERLLNILASKLPPEVDCFGWFDADILFSCNNLKEQCIEILNYYPVVQPWSYCRFLDSKGKPTEHLYSLASSNFIKDDKLRIHPGFAWCIRRDIWEKINGFYDYVITGSGDTFMGMGFTKNLDTYFLVNSGTNPLWIEHFKKWYDNCSDIVDKQLGFLDIKIEHLFHGTRKNRSYFNRLRTINSLNFEPNHIKINENGTFGFSNEAPQELKEYLSDYLLVYRGDDVDD